MNGRLLPVLTTILAAIVLSGGVWVGSQETRVEQNSRDIKNHANLPIHSDAGQRLARVEAVQMQILNQLVAINQKLDRIQNAD